MDDRLKTQVTEAAELLERGELQAAAEVLREVAENWTMSPADLRATFLPECRSRGIGSGAIARCLVESRRPPRPEFVRGNPRNIPPPWRRVETIGYITPLENVASIIARGLLSHSGAAKFASRSVANPQIQRHRQMTRVPVGGGREEPLHNFAIAYLNPRNAMLFSVRDDNVCVVRIRAQAAFILPGARVSDRNAATDRFQTYPSPSGLRELDIDEVMAVTWTVGQRRLIDRMQRMQAELLVPDRIPPELIAAVDVRTAHQSRQLRSIDRSVPVTVRPYTFFDG